MQSVTQRLSAATLQSLRVLCGRAFGIYYSGAPHLPTCSESTRAQAACFHLLGRQRSRSSRMQGVRSSCCSGVHCSARNAYIRAASAPRRRVCAAKTRPEVPPKTTPCRPATARPALPINETRGCACFGPKATSLAQGPAAGRAGASRRETPATAAHRPFAALPKHARLGASAFTRGSPISTTPSFERQASSEGARPRCDSAQRAAFPAAAPQRCCACYF